jgi:hypothetical protein
VDGHFSKFNNFVSELNIANLSVATVAMLLEIAPKYDHLSISNQSKGKF